MVKIITTLIPFVKELIFGKKGDQSSDPILVRFGKWIAFLILMGSIALNVLMFERLYAVSLNQVKVVHELTDARAKLKELEQLRQKNSELDRILNNCLGVREKPPK